MQDRLGGRATSNVTWEALFERLQWTLGLALWRETPAVMSVMHQQVAALDAESNTTRRA